MHKNKIIIINKHNTENGHINKIKTGIKIKVKINCNKYKQIKIK